MKINTRNWDKLFYIILSCFELFAMIFCAACFKFEIKFHKKNLDHMNVLMPDDRCGNE